MVEPREGEVNIQIENSLFDSYQNLKIEKRLNEVDTFEFTAFITDDTDRGLISEGQDILVFEDQEFVFKGRIEDTDYNSSYEVKVEGEGMATKLLDRKTDRDSFDNTPADQIIQEIIPLDTVSEGVVEEAPLTSLSFDHDNIARAVAGAANAVGFDWQLRQEPDDDFDTDFLDFKESIGFTEEERLFEEGFESGAYDDGEPANWVIGRGDETNFEVTSEVSFEGDNSLELTGEGDDEYIYVEQPVNINSSGVKAVIGNTDTAEGQLILSNDFSDTDTPGDVRANVLREGGFNVPETIKVEVITVDSDGDIIEVVEKEFTENPEKHWVDVSITGAGNSVEVTADLYDESGQFLETLDPIEAPYEGISQYDYIMLGSFSFSSVEDVRYFDDIRVDSFFQTFKIGENARLVENEQDDGFVANDITLLGRGDGINQLEARVFAAAEEFTQLQAEISEEETNNFTVDDTTVLGDTGDTIVAKVGAELINCTIDDATTLSINERGVENWEGEETPQILHRENISVWLYENITQGLGPFTPENQGSAQEGSSIADKGVKQLRETDKTIVKLPTLEQVADRELRNRFRSVQSVRVRTSEPRIGNRVELGDRIEVVGDLGTDLAGEYRVVGIDLNRRSSEEGTELICANRPRRLVERLSEIERDRDTLNAHMQGATNIDTQSFRDNCDQDNPLTSKIYVPDDAVAVNKLELNFAREDFRGYIQNQAHSHEIDDTSEAQTDPETTQYTVDDSATVTTNGDEDWVKADDFVIPSVVDDEDVSMEEAYFVAAVQIEGTENQRTASSKIRLVDQSTGEIYPQEPSFDGGTFEATSYLNTDTNAYTKNTVFIPIIGDRTGNTIDIEVNGGGVFDSGDISFFINYYYTIKGNHFHEIDSTTKDAGEPLYGIFEQDETSSVDVDVAVDGQIVETVSDVSPGEDVSQEIRIEDELSTPIAGSWHTVELIPSEQTRLVANIFQKVFIESTL